MHRNAHSCGQGRRTAPPRGGNPDHRPNRPAPSWRRAIPVAIAALLAWGCGSIPSSLLTGLEPYPPSRSTAETRVSRSGTPPEHAGTASRLAPAGGPCEDSTGGRVRIHVITFPEDDAEPVQTADTLDGDR